MVRIGHVMKRDLVSVDYGQAVSVAATLMRTRGIGSVLVKHEEEIVGIVTEADVVRKVVAMHRAPEFTPVENIMSSPLISINEDSPLFEAASKMEEAKTRHLAVADQGDIVGMLSARDLLHPVAMDEF